MGNDDPERAGSFPDLWVATFVHRPWWVPSRQWCYELQFATADAVAGALTGSRVDGTLKEGSCANLCP